MNLTKKGIKILSSIKYATLATSGDDGSPWNSPVFVAYDDEFNLYWSSHPESVHCQNIIRSGQVFIVVYDSTSDDGEGIYMQCQASIVSDKEDVESALSLLGARRGAPFEHIEKFMAPGPQRIFRAIPQHCWINDADKDKDGDFILDYRLAIDLKLSQS